MRNGPPEFRYTTFNACGDAILLAWNEENSEYLMLTFHRRTVLPAFGEATFIDLPDPNIDARVLIATGDSRPRCGCIFSGDRGFAVSWSAVAGRLTLASSRVPREWQSSDYLVYVSAELEDLKVQDGAGRVVSAPNTLLFSGLAGWWPGG